jgi:eukaryotic-like serine/threonine-protein kinase
LSEKLVQQSKTLAQSVGNPQAIALALLADAMIAIQAGEWKRTSTLSEEALAILRDQCVGLTWESNIAQNLVIWSLMYQGELGQLSRQVPVILANARSSGNLYIATELCTRSNFVWLAADDPDEGEREVIETIERWSQKGFHRQHYSATLARVQTELYRGRAQTAWALIDDCWPALQRTLLLRAQLVRVEASYLRARCALAMASSGRGATGFLRTAERETRRLHGEKMPWSDPLAFLLSAAVANLKGDTRTSARRLAVAADRFDLAGMRLYAAVVRRRLGALVGGVPGHELTRQSDEWMASEGIRNPASMTRMLAPGFPDVP